MSRFSKDSKYRLRDFSRRKRYSPNSVYVHSTLEHEYIPIHPFSDERDILSELELSPSECRSVDAWWNMGEDVCLLSVYCQQLQDNRENGIHAYWPKYRQRSLYLMAVVDFDNITRELFERIMLRACEQELLASEELRTKLSPNLTYICEIS